jgi:ABC-type uncharacterized transport system involved in gliding motility auxiliary subunit
MKKHLFFLAMLSLVFAFVSCNVEDTASNLTNNEEASTRTSALSLTVTFKNKSVATYSASKFIIGDDVDGVKVTLNPGILGSQQLTAVESVLINGGVFKVTRSNGTVYLNKTYLLATDAASGFNTTLNPGNITFNDTQIIGDDFDGV